MRRSSIPVLFSGGWLLLALISVGAPKASKSSSHPAKPASTKEAGKNRKATGHKAQGRVVGSRLVRTKSGRLTRVAVHAPPAPTYQTHPDPDRYTEIQKALADRGYFKGEPNGQWGDDSAEALRRFQVSANLPDDGKINALTLSGLGLGPRHDGSTASTVPLPGESAPSVTGSTATPPPLQ